MDERLIFLFGTFYSIWELFPYTIRGALCVYLVLLLCVFRGFLLATRARSITLNSSVDCFSLAHKGFCKARNGVLRSCPNDIAFGYGGVK